MTDDPLTMTREHLTDALRRYADGADMRAAVEMLIGYNDGDLLDIAEVRRHISPEGPDGARVDWTRLYASAAEDAGDLAMLGTTGIDALTLACALRAKVPIDSLARALRQFDKANSLAAMRAFATALGIDGWAQLCGDNASQAREIDRLEAEVRRRDDEINGLRNSMTSNSTMPPMYLVQEALDRAQGITTQPTANLGPTRRLHPKPATIDVSDQHLAERIVSLLKFAPKGLTAWRIAEILVEQGINTRPARVVVALGMLAAQTDNVSQPEPHGPYYWRASTGGRA